MKPGRPRICENISIATSKVRTVCAYNIINNQKAKFHNKTPGAGSTCTLYFSGMTLTPTVFLFTQVHVHECILAK